MSSTDKRRGFFRRLAVAVAVPVMVASGLVFGVSADAQDVEEIETVEQSSEGTPVVDDAESLDGAAEPEAIDGDLVEPEGLGEDAPEAPMMRAFADMGAVSATSSSLSCTPGDFYAIDRVGRVFKVNEGSSAFLSTDTPALNFNSLRSQTVRLRARDGQYHDFGRNYYGYGQVNGLAIGDGGNAVYAFDRGLLGKNGYAGESGVVGIYEWDTENGSRVGTYFNPNNILASTSFIGGGTNPQTVGKYYFGGYHRVTVDGGSRWVPGYYDYNNYVEGHWERRRFWDSYNQYYYYQDVWVDGYYPWIKGHYEKVPDTVETRFQLFSYDSDSQQVAHLGYVVVDTEESTATFDSPNGDLAFDRNGNLYLLYHNGKSLVRVVPVTAGNIAKAESSAVTASGEAPMSAVNASKEIESQSVRDLQVPLEGKQFNGLAFGANGYMYVESSNTDAAPTMTKIDPGTGAVEMTTQLSSRWNFGTDLASCTDFPTIELKKDVVSRAKDTDQFTLEIIRSAEADGTENIVVADATTRGDATGVQDQQAGPIPAVAGKKYRIRESGAVNEGSTDAPANLARYMTDVQCINNESNTPVKLSKVEGRSYEWEFTVPDTQLLSIPIVSCTYTNEASADVAWSKVDAEAANDADDAASALLAGSKWDLRAQGSNDVIATIEDYVCDGDATECKKELADDVYEDIAPKAGEFYLTKLPYGTYTLTEIEAPEGYKLLEDPIEFTIDASNSAEGLYRINGGKVGNEKKKGTVTWSKVDAGDPQTALGGSEWTFTKGDETFTVVDNVGQNDYDGRDVNDVPGEFTVEDLDFGEWTVEETKAPRDLHFVPGTKYSVTVSPEKPNVQLTTSGKVENYKTRLEWNKVGKDQDGETTTLRGSEWSLTGPDSDTKRDIKDCTAAPCATEGHDLSVEPGKFSVDALKNGTYTLKETKAPQGYLVDDKEYTIVVTDTGYSVDGKEKQPFTVANGAKTIAMNVGDIENLRDEAAVEWNKVDAANTETVLGGSTWTLTPLKDDETPDSTKPVITVEDNGARDANTDDGRFRVEKLPVGKYLLQETVAPKGYVISDELKKGRVIELTQKNLTEALEVGDLDNQKIEADVAWQKIEEGTGSSVTGKKLLAGSEWKIVAKNDDGTWDEDNAIVVVDNGNNDADDVEGQLKYGKLPEGQYKLVETKAPKGYEISPAASEGYAFTITEDNFTEAIKIAGLGDSNMVSNKLILGKVTWNKIQKGQADVFLEDSEWSYVRVNDDKSPIEGEDATQVTDCVADSETGCAGEVDKDPKAGHFAIEDLPVGTYKLWETKAPAGFTLDPTEHYFVVSQQGTARFDNAEEGVAASFENELGKGVKLPLTGGTGADMFYIIGGLLGAIAAVMGGAHVMRRRN
ncbi:SpaA isopeptide-forming pilin-related protein [Corynebacterium phoceense]|uniref:SpaA isopeptide-forming pilin-related protein n=1 Tax=Corynebacterium phoceense TaxID=1686286 RepID=UPI00211CC565|nr:SpaA isopeptide-forming pilin-related protein [Corynebacterium phoceense]MCQ9341161.1 SpaA isopeptide-forming pilin-related protein [Corynebacterium phoceense]MCQ9348896.1 SpaA isopeptide-forming pilin-related protein [Corynebacterium phoceense]